MPTCAVTNCWNEAVGFNVGDRLRGSYCEEHQDVAQESVHNSVSGEIDRFGDAWSREGIESDTTESRGTEREGTIPPAEKIGETPKSPPPGETVSKTLDS